jgi:tRNA A37 N6-isopentenylltransferase MiaA
VVLSTSQEAIAAVKAHTRAYARDQLRWIDRHFRARLPVYHLDCTRICASLFFF